MRLTAGDKKRQTEREGEREEDQWVYLEKKWSTGVTQWPKIEESVDVIKEEAE